jgi:hypothetical protein
MNIKIIIVIIVILFLVFTILYNNNKHIPDTIRKIHDNIPKKVRGLSVNKINDENDRAEYLIQWNRINNSKFYLVTYNNTPINDIQQAKNLPNNNKSYIYDENNIQLNLPKNRTWYIQVSASYGENCYGELSDNLIINT